MAASDEIPWQWRGETVRVGVSRLGTGPTILLLPALSSISTRHEMRPLQQRLAERFTTVSNPHAVQNDADLPRERDLCSFCAAPPGDVHRPGPER